jgi:hypothetical protein
MPDAVGRLAVREQRWIACRATEAGVQQAPEGNGDSNRPTAPANLGARTRLERKNAALPEAAPDRPRHGQRTAPALAEVEPYWRSVSCCRAHPDQCRLRSDHVTCDQPVEDVAYVVVVETVGGDAVEEASVGEHRQRVGQGAFGVLEQVVGPARAARSPPVSRRERTLGATCPVGRGEAGCTVPGGRARQVVSGECAGGARHAMSGRLPAGHTLTVAVGAGPR